MHSKRNKKIVVGMSGGVDSFASALLLKEQGFEVIGVTFITWNRDTNAITIPIEKSTPYNIALKVAQTCKAIGIQHHILDLTKEFEETVIQYFISEYLSGSTPNICAFCNQSFKFKYLYKASLQFNCDYIATGHYARIHEENKRYVISRSIDDWKDQSFMLWQLPQQILQKCIFPLENNQKEEVKQYVAKSGFAEMASQRESFSICFIPDGNYKQFLCNRVEGLEAKLSEGEIVNIKGERIGTHNGFPFYTIGQCNNLQTNTSSKLYVKEIIPQKNQLIVSSKEDVFTQTIAIGSLNFIKYETLEREHSFFVRIRGKDPGTHAKVLFKNNEAIIYFEQPVFAPAVGQSVVIYENNDVVCGGLIKILSIN